jgi:hypothetical protein
MPTVAPPPGLFTTMIGTGTSFSVWRMFWMVRAVLSTPLPGAVATMNSTGFSGRQAVAAFTVAENNVMTIAANRRAP